MAKEKTIWTCLECGHNQPKWSGQCVQCQKWNVFNQELSLDQAKSHARLSSYQKHQKPLRLDQIKPSAMSRFTTDFVEFDRLVGGGIVQGSLSLVGGDPGIGKSTLLMQIAQSLANQDIVVLYICGEESVEQVYLRAKRLGLESKNLLLFEETEFSSIKTQIEKIKPSVVIIDSIQIVYKNEVPSLPGSVAQVRETAIEFMFLAKSLNISFFLIGHVTKSGEIAGPRILEHLVDSVLYFEGDRQHNYRILRVVKNRFGPTDEIAVFQMEVKGLKEIHNPSEIFLEERVADVTGSVIVPTIEGSRPILIEAQALVTDTVFSSPSRKCTGFDQNRLSLLLAVLEKRVGYSIYNSDVFVSIAGGLRIVEPAIDLGILIAIASSFLSKKIDAHTIVFGEVGLGGDVRRVPRMEVRVKEAHRMGFKRCILPKKNLNSLAKTLHSSMELIGVDYVEKAIKFCVDS